MVNGGSQGATGCSGVASLPAAAQDLQNAVNDTAMPPNVQADLANLYQQQAQQLAMQPIPNGFPSYGLTNPSVWTSPSTQVSQTASSAGTTTVTEQSTVSITPPAVSGQPYTVKETTTSTSVMAPPVGSPQVTSTTTTAPIINPLTPSPTTSTGGTPAPQIPTDYNREVTQQKIQASLDTTGLQDTTSEASDIATLTGDSGALPIFDRSGLKGSVSLPASTGGSCTPLVLAFHGIAWNWDYCSLQTYLHPLINYMFIFMFAILAFRTAFSKGEIK